MPNSEITDTWIEVAVTTSHQGHMVEHRFATNATDPKEALRAAFQTWSDNHDVTPAEAVIGVDELTLGSFHIVRLPYREPDLRLSV